VARADSFERGNQRLSIDTEIIHVLAGNHFHLLVGSPILYSIYCIDYRCEDKKKVGELRGDSSGAAVDTFSLPLSENLIMTPNTRTIELGNKLKDTAFKLGFEIVKF
jgi:hypothetical protein